MLSIYLSIVVLFFALGARVRMPSRDVFWMSLLWPLTVVLRLVEFITNSFGWQFDMQNGNGKWGVRRPKDGWPGVAICCPWVEFQFWKTRN